MPCPSRARRCVGPVERTIGLVFPGTKKYSLVNILWHQRIAFTRLLGKISLCKHREVGIYTTAIAEESSELLTRMKSYLSIMSPHSGLNSYSLEFQPRRESDAIRVEWFLVKIIERYRKNSLHTHSIPVRSAGSWREFLSSSLLCTNTSVEAIVPIVWLMSCLRMENQLIVSFSLRGLSLALSVHDISLHWQVFGKYLIGLAFIASEWCVAHLQPFVYYIVHLLWPELFSSLVGRLGAGEEEKERRRRRRCHRAFFSALRSTRSSLEFDVRWKNEALGWLHIVGAIVSYASLSLSLFLSLSFISWEADWGEENESTMERTTGYNADDFFKKTKKRGRPVANALRSISRCA